MSFKEIMQQVVVMLILISLGGYIIFISEGIETAKLFCAYLFICFGFILALIGLGGD